LYASGPDGNPRAFSHRSPYLPVEFHAFHSSALCPSWQKAICCWMLTPALPVNPAASVSDCVGSQVVGCVAHRVHRLWERGKDPAFDIDLVAIADEPGGDAAA